MLASPKVKQAFDLSRGAGPAPRRLRPDDLRPELPAGPPVGRGGRAVRHGLLTPRRSAAGQRGGWDTHGDNFNAAQGPPPARSPTRPCPTLIDDLACARAARRDADRLDGRVRPVARGRSTPTQFGPDGRDHWPQCYTVLFAGGGITPGAIHGSSDRIGAYPATDPVTPDDIAATMFWALGIDPATEVFDTLDRPFRSPPASRSRGSSPDKEDRPDVRDPHPRLGAPGST